MPDSAAFDADVLIVGAGPAGLVLSVALAQAGLRSRVLEQAPRDALAQPVEDGRDIAMTYRSRRIFDRLGLWQRLPQDDIAPLKAAQVTERMILESPRWSVAMLGLHPINGVRNIGVYGEGFDQIKVKVKSPSQPSPSGRA